jgi:hypothetical protein
MSGRRISAYQFVRAWPQRCPRCEQKQYGSDTENTLHTFYCKGLKPRIKVLICFPQRGGELKLTKNLKKVIVDSFLKDRSSAQRLAALYGLSVAQIENTIREAIMDQENAAELVAQEKGRLLEENARLIAPICGAPGCNMPATDNDDGMCDHHAWDLPKGDEKTGEAEQK